MKPILPALLAALVVLPSCGSSPGPAEHAIQIALSPEHASGSPEHPLTFASVVRNAGLNSIWYYEGCGPVGGIRIDYYDPQGNLVLTKDPYAPQPACGYQLVTLVPGGELENASSFDGTLYGFEPDPADRRHPAPPGRYRAAATFTYYRDPAQRHPEVVLAQSVEFDWDGPDSNQVALTGSARESCMLTHHFILYGGALNTGNNPVRYPSGCSPIQVHLFDPSGNEVIFQDPAKATPCTDPFVTLRPGEQAQAEFDFDGDAYFPVAGGYDRKRAPEGLYTIRFEFRYVDGNSVEGMVTQSATFVWSNAVTCGT